jgi:hypothetical protein
MRRILVFLLVFALAIPALAFAARAALGDGGLVVRDANGTVVVQGKGLIYGHIERGALTVVGEYKPDDATAPSISGARMGFNANLDVVYSGRDVRFMFPGGKYTLRFDGLGIDISAVGKGVVVATGFSTLDGGELSVNGGKLVALGPNPIKLAYGGNSVSGGKSQQP